MGLADEPGVCQARDHLSASWEGARVDRVVAWSTVAVVTTVTALFLTLVQSTSCVDAATGEGVSSCSTGPVIGVAGAWIVCSVAAVVVAASIWRIVRARRSAGRGTG